VEGVQSAWLDIDALLAAMSEGAVMSRHLNTEQKQWVKAFRF
jgi:hypothetical protein